MQRDNGKNELVILSVLLKRLQTRCSLNCRKQFERRWNGCAGNQDPCKQSAVQVGRDSVIDVHAHARSTSGRRSNVATSKALTLQCRTHAR